MVGLTTTTANADGDIIFYENPDSELRKLDARVSRTATLDGGAVIVHGGVTWADATLKIVSDITEADELKLRAIYESESLFYLSTALGFFSGAISYMDVSDGTLKLTFLVEEKLSA
uniref:Tail protein n=1 Tax=viral metagenome TaxID=1070528 RepID=A0A6M3KER5_9ZZZZ